MCPPSDDDRTLPAPDDERSPRPGPARRPDGPLPGEDEEDPTLVSGDATLLSGDATFVDDEGEATFLDEDDAGAPTLVGEDDAGESAEPTLLEGEQTLAAEMEPPAAPANSKVARAPAAAQNDVGEKQVFAGRFEVVSVLGEGGMGKVFHVRDRQIQGREVALKVLRQRYSRNEEFRELFFQEIHAAQNFVSEQVNQVRDTGQMKDGKLFLTMDLVDGESLSSLLDREGSLAPRHALEIGRQILIGLQSGHEKGFVHRDVKPANIMLAAKIPKTEENPFGVGVRILDFGIAGIAADTGGGVAGTPKYMSPEQIRGERLDPRSDLFSVGVVIYEALSGHRPFEGDTLQEVQTAVLETDMAPLIGQLGDLPTAVQKLLRRALRKDRRKRFQGATDFVEAIESSRAFKEEKKLSGWLVALAVLLFLAGLAEGYFLLELNKKLASTEEYEQIHRAVRSRSLPTDPIAFSAEIDGLRGWRDALTHEGISLAEVAELADAKRKFGDVDVDVLRQKSTDQASAMRLLDQIGLFEVKLGSLTSDNPLLDEERNDLKREAQGLRALKTELSEDPYDEYLENPSRLVQRLDKEGTQDKKIDELQAQLDSIRGRDSVDGKAWTNFALLLTLLSTDDPRTRNFESGEELIKSLRKEVSAFGSRDPRGGALIESLIRASEALHRHRESEPPRDAAPLETAGQQLDAASKSLELLEQTAPAWITWVDPALDPDPLPRDLLKETAMLLGTLNAELQSLHDDHEFALGKQDADLEALWREHLARESGTETEALLAFVKENPDFATPTRLDEPLTRFTQLLESRGIEDDGSLDLPGIDDTPGLESWSTYLATNPAFVTESAQSVRRLHAASRWYRSGEWGPETLALFDPDDAATHVESAPWRARVALQVGLAAPDSAWPLRRGLEAVARREDGWYLYRSKGKSGNEWKITRQLIDGNGVGEEEPYDVVEESAGTYLYKGKTLVDLLSPDVELRFWEPDLTVLPTARWAAGKDFDGFRERVERAPVLCIVHTNGSTIEWFCPRFGYVRSESTRGLFTRDLVYIDE